MCGHLGGQGSLVAGRTAELVERQGHGLDVLLAGVPHQAGERTGVDPRGEEGADRHVRDEVVTDGVEHGRADGPLDLGSRHRAAPNPLPPRRRDGEVRHRRVRTRRIDPLVAARGDGADLLVEGKRLGDAAEQVEPGQARRLRHARDARAREQCLHL